MNRYTAKFGKPSFEVLVATTVEAFPAVHAAIQSGQGEWSFDKNDDIQGIRPVINVIRNGAPATVR